MFGRTNAPYFARHSATGIRSHVRVSMEMTRMMVTARRGVSAMAILTVLPLVLGACAPESDSGPAGTAASAGGVPTFGFYCCGEFARTAGVLGTHNATLTGLAL